MDGILIRAYRPQDRQAVRDIAWETAFLGKPGSVFFSDKELLQDVLTAYFTDYEPQSCFVAQEGNEVVGYLLGALDERRVGRIAGKELAPGLLARFFLRDFFVAKNAAFLWRMTMSWLRGEFRGEHFYADYPAILHINLKEGSRGRGAGSLLIKSYLDLLREKKVRGVHLATMTAGGAPFFQKQGFTLLSRHERTYFRNVTPDTVMVSIFGKKLL